jgi:hypothetical protein
MNGEKYVAKTLLDDLKMDRRAVVAECKPMQSIIFSRLSHQMLITAFSAVSGHLRASSTAVAGQLATCNVVMSMDYRTSLYIQIF